MVFWASSGRQLKKNLPLIYDDKNIERTINF